MNLEPLRATLTAEVEADENRHRAEVDEMCERQLARVRARARALARQSRLEGEQAAAQEARRRLGAASRRARELRLAAQRALIDELRLRAREAALQVRTDPGYQELLDRLSQAARSQLGPEAELELDPPELGGLLARAASRSVDYTLAALVDRAIVDLDGEVEALWL